MSIKKQQEFDIKIETLNERGYGVGITELNGKNCTVFVLGALPGETLRVETFKKKRGDIFARAIEVLVASAERVIPREPDHYFASSPWQILSDKGELNQKKQIITSSFFQYCGIDLESQIAQSPILWNYRNKVEFSFFEDWESGIVSLAYFKREGNKGKYPIQSCQLMPENVNIAATGIVKIINENKISSKTLKTLLIRYSFSQKKAVLSLFVTEMETWNLDRDYKSLFSNVLEMDFVQSVNVYFSNPQSPASIITETIYQSGNSNLTENIMGTSLEYNSDSFFQINPVAFELVMVDLKKWLGENKTKYDFKNKILLDFYSGVGTIGLMLESYFKSIIGVENSKGSKKLANQNAASNMIENAVFWEEEAENLIHHINGHNILLLDPPRIGLHLKVIEKIQQETPPLIIYLSCNPISQAQNISFLIEKYDIIFNKGYNFYPHTPHMEHLVILKLKEKTVELTEKETELN